MALISLNRALDIPPLLLPLAALGAAGVRLDCKHQFLSVNRISLSCMNLIWAECQLSTTAGAKCRERRETSESDWTAIGEKKLKIPLYETINWLHLSRCSSSELMFRFFAASFAEFSARKQTRSRARVIGWVRHRDGNERSETKRERDEWKAVVNVRRVFAFSMNPAQDRLFIRPGWYLLPSAVCIPIQLRAVERHK